MLDSYSSPQWWTQSLTGICVSRVLLHLIILKLNIIENHFYSWKQYRELHLVCVKNFSHSFARLPMPSTSWTAAAFSCFVSCINCWCTQIVNSLQQKCWVHGAIFFTMYEDFSLCISPLFLSNLLVCYPSRGETMSIGDYHLCQK